MSKKPGTSGKPPGLPQKKARGAGATLGYHEDRQFLRSVARNISTDVNGRTASHAFNLRVPQVSLGILERTAKATASHAAPAPEALNNQENDERVSPPPPVDANVGDTTTAELSISNHPLLEWIPKRMQYLWALLKLDGRPPEVISGAVSGCVRPGCPRGKAATVLYRCVSGCASCEWVCKGCILKEHSNRPLDRVEVYIRDEWVPVSLRQLGLTVQLGHWAGDVCHLKRHVYDKFVVIHTNGVHQVRVAYCGCTKDKVHRRDQLLAYRWYPATTLKPQTAATFELLDAFDAHSGAGKDNAYDYYNALVTLTDGAGIFHLPDRSKEFFRIAHERRHLESLKRAGRGHDAAGGVESTQYGELAVLCPACPHQGINTDVVEAMRRISPEMADAHDTFNTMIQLAMDCNFRAKNRMTRSTPETSPYLGDGMAYMVPEEPYADFTKDGGLYDAEMSNCSRFGATIMANLKNGKGLRTTGIGAVFCARHEFFWPNTIGTLIKGERYNTMDFIFASALRRVRVPIVKLYYDIICQYTRNLNIRMLQVPSQSFIHVGAQKLLHQINITFGIPKFHNPGHLVICQLWFNLAFIRGIGNTDGEASERAWAGLNPAASSLREMGPGTMRDTIDFFCGVWNWKKFINIGAFLVRKMDIALAAAIEHCEMYTGLLGAVRAENAVMADGWIDETVVYEGRAVLDELGRPIVSGPNAVKNPYESRTQKQSLEKARLQSAAIADRAVEEESNDGDQQAALTNFVLRAFKIEVLQRRAAKTKEGRTVIQKRERVEQSTELKRQIRLFRKDQQWLMPSIYAAIQELEGSEPVRATVDVYGEEDEDEDEGISGTGAAVMCLPSELDRDLARGVLNVLLEELKLRFSGMEDWLDILRQQLRVRGTVKQWKIEFSTGQRMATRTINKQRVIQENIEMARDMYRVHRERYKTLVSFLTEEELALYVADDWEDLFQELRDNDCRPLSNSLLLAIDAEEVRRVRQFIAARKDGVASGQSSYRIPWIWYKVAEGTELELNDGSSALVFCVLMYSRFMDDRSPCRAGKMSCASDALGGGSVPHRVRDASSAGFLYGTLSLVEGANGDATT
ncbi:unnamed protein product [Peniophora sp. CBMAI 1063]|nr:unnamed protein product [Peniophora sp. CBMAI 1063]